MHVDKKKKMVAEHTTLLMKAMKHFIFFGVGNITLKGICINILKIKNRKERNLLCNWSISLMHASYSSYLSCKALSYNQLELYHEVFKKYDSNNMIPKRRLRSLTVISSV